MSSVATTANLIGSTLEGRYRIVREIGRGGMGVVFEGEHVELGKRVAIKLMRDEYATDSDATARFRREALAASRIGNSHIIDVSHIGTAADGRPFVVMELLIGTSLAREIERGAIPYPRAIHIIRQVLRAVGAAHAKGIVHRDLKPDNIFLIGHDDQRDFVKLLDFGISKMLDSADVAVAHTKLTTTGMIMGTPLYMAPEQAMGEAIDHRVDIYACGVILYEMLAGKPPFEGATYPVLIAKMLTTDAQPIAERVRGLPATTTEQTAPAKSRTGLAIGLGAIAAIGVGVGVFAIVSSRSPDDNKLAGIASGATTATGSNGGSNGISATPVPPPPTQTPAAAPIDAAVEQTGDLHVETVPNGANIKVDHVLRGPSAIDVVLAPGTHELEIELAGYVTLTEDVTVTLGGRTPITRTLTAKSALAHKPSTPATPAHPPQQPPHTIVSRPPPQTLNPPPAFVHAPADQTATPPTQTPTEAPKDPPHTTGSSKPNPYQ